MREHSQWMQQALHLAEKGRGFTSPNPMVGAVIVKNRQIIGQGFHQKFGGPHAEVLALREAGNAAKGATLYVTLEPCVHHGKTPPCVPQIIQAGICEVYISMIDPNPLVNQEGIRRLKEAGIKVYTGLLEDEARILNRGFMYLMEKKRPWITLKMAQTADGYIADLKGNSKWITAPPARDFVASQRLLYDGVMVGVGTVLKDNPGLLPKKRDGYVPWRIILDETLQVPETAQVVSDDFKHRTLIVTLCDENKKLYNHFSAQGIHLLSIQKGSSGRVTMGETLKCLGEFGITSIYCEGGSHVAGSLLYEKICDELQLFIAPKVLGEGLSTFGGFRKSIEKPLPLIWDEIQKIGPDVLVRGRLDPCLQD
ncbi:MAG: bifunctional diaminohydroxyphosphoribosylaminopyrimidine deaminase/5-amino-6-(5-phosphoribosylamino)uracil reductase RibD [Candidatus Marinimicrobia bacterium]|nr:bifunctional diaminohydroxyphosphoribosylaminopyrimidine deaminase/5-amino-6-(5-phosphoribosylamino)uracil reductase RibD [Candidatus Neomarinimicrobiota bacterium]